MYTLIRPYLLTGDIFDKLRQRHSTIRTWDSVTRIISSATESKRNVCSLPFENKLFGYIHYCTDISEIDINLLPNTCNFHRKFRFIFFRYISLRMRKMCTLEKLNFKISRGSMPPDPPSIHAPSALDIFFCRINSEMLPPGLLLPIGNTQFYITYLTYTKRCFFSQ